MEQGTAADAEFDFPALIHPLNPGKFFAEHWERRPLLLHRDDDDYYRCLLSIRDIEEFISHGDVRYPAIRLAKGGVFFPPEAYTRDVRYGDEVFRGLVDLEKIITEYSTGATVTLRALHRFWPALGRLCAQMETEIDSSIHTNAYLTPAHAAGLTPHYDTHDVFVLQIAGTKRWRVYPPPLQLPHRSQLFSREHYTLPAGALMECELSAGDLLYLPRGYVHTTIAGSRGSAHVSIGVTVHTWVELLAELAQQAIETPALRKALPPGFAHLPELRADLERQLAQLLSSLSRDVDPRTLIERFVRRVRAGRPRTAAYFRTDSQLGADSVLRVAPGLDYHIVPEGDGIILEIEGRRVRLESAVAGTLDDMCGVQSFTPAQLTPALSLQVRLSLVRYLHGLGFLQLL